MGHNSKPVLIDVDDCNHDHYLDIVVSIFDADTIFILRDNVDGIVAVLTN